MVKSVVLKDINGVPRGYLRETNEGVFCRVAVDQPAQAKLIFADGTATDCMVEQRKSEQLIISSTKPLCGTCIFRDDELLLTTDDHVKKMFFEQRAERKKRSEAEMKRVSTTEKEAVFRQAKQENNDVDACAQRCFPDRRWPPPPCLDMACYECGRWCEKRMPSG